MKTLNVNTLVEDYTLYPRCDVDTYHVNSIMEGLMVGVELPPIIADKKSLRIADGFHRVKAIKKLYGKDGTVLTILKDYKSDSELFLDAVRFNAGHGRSLTAYDKTHCIIKAGELNISNLKISKALNITKQKAGKLSITRIGNKKIKFGKNIRVPIKRTIQHMAGKDLTQNQIDANEKLSGMAQLFTVNQLIILIENDLIDRENKMLMDRIEELRILLNNL
jgi:ribosomal protein L24